MSGSKLSREGIHVDEVFRDIQEEAHDERRFRSMTVLFGAILAGRDCVGIPAGPTNNNDDPYNPTDFTPSLRSERSSAPDAGPEQSDRGRRSRTKDVYGRSQRPKGRHGQLDLGHRLGQRDRQRVGPG